MLTDPGTILVVDDTALNRDMLSRRLRREGHTVVVAEGGAEALAALAREAFDLVLLDVMMPVMDGLEVLASLRRSHSLAELPVIMVTARDQSADMVEALALGANDYVAKPIDFPVLLARVRTQLALRRLSRLKDEFLAIASHDLKNPLSEVYGAASLIEAMSRPGEPMPPQAHDLLGLVRRGARRMQGLIEDFLDGHALTDGQLALGAEAVDLTELAFDMAEANQAYAVTKGVTLWIEPDSASPLGLGDRRRLVQVVQNLVDNAIKFCPPGAKVTLRTALRDGRVVLEVADTGPGLTEADLAQVFQKYARLSNRPTGNESSTGLGLAQCRQLMRAMNGELAVRTAPQGGAVFWLTLPEAEPTPTLAR
ncbi:MAG: response regulator [Candidatus Sericytochromatia bacterium]